MFQAIKDHIAAFESAVEKDVDAFIAGLKALVDKAEEAPDEAEKAPSATVSGSDLATHQHTDGPGGSTTGGNKTGGGTHEK